MFSVMMDFMRGFRALHFVGPCITVFGSARFKDDHPHYQMAREMGAAIARTAWGLSGLGWLPALRASTA